MSKLQITVPVIVVVDPESLLGIVIGCRSRWTY